MISPVPKVHLKRSRQKTDYYFGADLSAPFFRKYYVSSNMAEYYDASVSGVCGPDNIQMVKSLGEENVFDYTKGDYSVNCGKFDLVFDAVGQLFTGKKIKFITGCLKKTAFM